MRMRTRTEYERHFPERAIRRSRTATRPAGYYDDNYLQGILSPAYDAEIDAILTEGRGTRG